MLKSVFVKGNLVLRIDQLELNYLQKNISVFGVTGLPWTPLNPGEHFGRTAYVDIKIETPEKIQMRTPAQILMESTIHAKNLALKFYLSSDQKDKLETFVEKHGYYPTEYIRKYPRIPSNHMIQTYPLRALVSFEKRKEVIIFDVENLSPNGILISTENQIAMNIRPGDRIDMKLDPRGWFPFQIHLQGLVCRIVDDIQLESGNVNRRLGIKFMQIQEVDRKAFITLLRDILEQIKNTQGG